MDPQLRVAPAAERNKLPILNALRELLPESGRMLEIASGFGQHALFIAEHLSRWTVQPSDVARDHVETIDAWRKRHPVANFLPPKLLDVERLPWPVGNRFDAVLNINMIHISPWSATVALFDGATDVLRPGGVLVTYGPYRIDGAHTSESNAAFDERLKAMDPRFGIRDLAELHALARARELTPLEPRPMPANNYVLVFSRS